MAGISSYRDLRVWQEGMSLVEQCYRLTATFSKDELFGLSSQIKRAAVSVPANISEGYGRGSTRSYVHFLKIARGSLCELEAHLLLVTKLELALPDTVALVLGRRDVVARLLHKLIQSLGPAAAED